MSDSALQPPKKAVVFLRAGNDPKTADASLAQQRRVCQTLARRLNAQIVQEFVEIGRSSAERRPVLERLLDSLDHRPVDYLIVSDAWRLARSIDWMTRVQARLRTAGTELVTDTSRSLLENVAASNDPTLLAKMIKEKRQELGLSANAIARLAGVTPSTVTRIEAAQIHNPRADSIMAIARVLGISVSDLLATADWLPEGELPAFKPYLRVKYGDLPPEALDELEASFARLAKRHGYDPKGPAPGEDET